MSQVEISIPLFFPSISSDLIQFDSEKKQSWFKDWTTYPNGSIPPDATPLTLPPNHPLRCQAPSATTRLQCGRIANTKSNSDFCSYHLGHGKTLVDNGKHPLAKMANRLNLPTKLREAVDRISEASSDGGMTFMEELSLSRRALEEASVMFHLVCEEGTLDKPNPDGSDEKIPNIIARRKASDHLNKCSNAVLHLSGKISSVGLMQSGQLNLSNIKLLTDRITQVLGKRLAGIPNAESILQQIIDDIDEIKLEADPKNEVRLVKILCE